MLFPAASSTFPAASSTAKRADAHPLVAISNRLGEDGTLCMHCLTVPELLIKKGIKMSKVVVIGIEGEAGLWMADLDAGTVTAIDAPTAADPRREGEVVIRGVNLAALAQTSEPLSGGYMDK